MSTVIMQITAAGGSAQNVFSESFQKKKKKNNEQGIIFKVIFWLLLYISVGAREDSCAFPCRKMRPIFPDYKWKLFYSK